MWAKKQKEESGTVIFLHIPKTAGLTLYGIFDRLYGRARIYTFVGGRQRLEQSLHTFTALSEAQRSAFQLIRGHVPFGIHEMLTKSFTYVTFLRDPVQRVISHYYYVRNNPNHLLYETVTSQNMSLETYVLSGINYELDNGQTRQLAGVTDEVAYGACDKDLLEQAKANLETYFPVAGLTERFDESLLLMRYFLGWQKYPYYVPQNVSHRKPVRSEIPAQTVKLIARYNELDSALYAQNQARFAALMHAIDKREVARFQQWNRLYYPMGNMKSTIRSFLRQLRSEGQRS